MRKSLVQMLVGTTILFAASPSIAQQIIAPVSATINAAGPGYGSITNTIDQSGLSSNYIGGVTNFDSFLATNPTHTTVFAGNEWFSNIGSTATVTYDFGALIGISGLALWNEESSGIGFLNVLTSQDGLSFTSLFSATPTDNPTGPDYAATIYNFAAVSTRYARFEMSQCDSTVFRACAIGEVAFRSAAAISAVPEPSVWAMMLIGFGGIGLAMRASRRREHALKPSAA